MNYSQLLNLPCELESACAAAGLPAGSTWGSVVISLMERIESLTKQQSEAPTTGFRPVPKVTADSILLQLAVEQMFCCPDCADRLRAMLARWKLSGIIQTEDDSPDTQQSAKRLAEKLLQ
jgi:hypothetical protein